MKSFKLFFSALLFIFCMKGIAQTTTYRNVDAVHFKEMIAKNDGVIVDLRTPNETKKGIITGAIEIDFLAKDFEDKIAQLDKTKRYYVYCQAGGRSADAAEYMAKQGFTQVINLDKGFGNWLKLGFPTETK